MIFRVTPKSVRLKFYESNTSNPTQLALFLKFDNINQLSSSQPIKIQYIHRP